MTMKLKNLTLAAFMVATSSLLTACLNVDDDKHTSMGYYTVTGDYTKGYILYQDGGGYIVPTASSVASLTNGKGFEDIERVLLSFTFQDKDLSEDKNSILGAELFSGESIPVIEPISLTTATEKGVVSADSLFAVKGLTGLWAYRGFLTIGHAAHYAWNEKKNGYLYPTFNLVYCDTLQIPNELNLTLCHNERRPKTGSTAGENTFTNSYRLDSIESLIPGKDSVKLNISMMGIDKPYTIKVAREDFHKNNWR